MTRAQIGKAMRVTAALATACCVTLSGVDRASARDDGVLQFFTSVFGGAGAASGQAAPAEDAAEQQRQARPLTVRPRRTTRLAVAALPVKPEKVAIFQDRTLRRGDAVMTAKGMRIFMGSNAWPYRSEDFVDLADSGREVSKATEKVLADLDKRPGG